jgi:hypothetical protein
MMKVRSFQPYVLFCVLPWVLPAFLWLNPILHPEPDYLHKLKIAAVWSLLVVLPGFVFAFIDAWRSRSVVAFLCLISVLGFVAWFPWDAFNRIIAL